MTEPHSARAKIMSLAAYPPERYESVDLNRLSVYTIHKLDELDVPTTLEHIAVATFRMFPKRFAMVGFPEYPDVARVNRSLLQLRPKYRNWATGKTRIGWTLTVAGVEEAKVIAGKLGETPTAIRSSLSAADVQAEAGGRIKRTIHTEDVIGRIQASPLFGKFRQGWKDVEALEVYDVLDAYTHTPADALRRKLSRLKTVAATAGDREVIRFLDELGTRFSLLFEHR